MFMKQGIGPNRQTLNGKAARVHPHPGAVVVPGAGIEPAPLRRGF